VVDEAVVELGPVEHHELGDRQPVVELVEHVHQIRARHRGEEDDELVIEDVLAAMPAKPGAGPIEADEILDLHLLLKDFEGSLDDLLKAPNRSR